MSDPFDVLVENLRGKVPVCLDFMTKENAYEALKRISGEDWGYDADAWAKRKSAIKKHINALAKDSRVTGDCRKREVALRKRWRTRKKCGIYRLSF